MVWFLLVPSYLRCLRCRNMLVKPIMFTATFAEPVPRTMRDVIGMQRLVLMRLVMAVFAAVTDLKRLEMFVLYLFQMVFRKMINLKCVMRVGSTSIELVMRTVFLSL